MMTNIFRLGKTVFVVAFLSMITSCGDFLEEKSQDLFIPKTVQDYKEFVAGEMLNMGQHNGVVLAEYLDILTDDVSDRVKPRRKDSQDSREKMWGYYSWQAEPEIDFNNTFTADQLWDVAYHRILTANIILNRLPEITGEQAKKNDLEAEVRFIRAWSYFMLVNVYAKPYEDATQASTTIAVPLNTATSVENRQLKRATLADIYTLIEEDLTKAVSLFSETNITKNIYRPNLNASLLLLSRVALYTKQYQKAADWATQLINNGSVKLFDLSKQPVRSTLRFFDEENKEILFTFGSRNAYRLYVYVSASGSEKGCYAVNPTLYSMFNTNDRRKNAFFTSVTGGGIKPFKFYQNSSKNMLPGALHLSEAYLNRAEAYVELGQVAKAVDDLNTIRANRIANYTNVSITNADDAKQEVRKERRMELCFEGLRWFDLRRWGCPELKHTYNANNGTSPAIEYTLNQGDERYTLPIPRRERNLNYHIME